MSPEQTEQQNPPTGEQAPEQQAQAAPTVLPPADSQAAQPSLPETQEQAPKPDFFKTAFAQSMGRTPAPEAPPASEGKVEAEAPQAPEPTGEAKPNVRVRTPQRQREQKPDAPATTDRPLTQEEFNRAVQAETDRRLEKWNREQARARQEREEKALRQNDPYAYAKLMEEREAENTRLQQQLEATTTFATGQVRQYDTMVLDPLLSALSDGERKRILTNVPAGIPGRGQVASEAIKTLRREAHAQGMASARKALMQDQAFIKEVLARYGGIRQEPDSNPAMQQTQRPLSMSDLMRRAARGVPV